MPASPQGGRRRQRGRAARAECRAIRDGVPGSPNPNPNRSSVNRLSYLQVLVKLVRDQATPAVEGLVLSALVAAVGPEGKYLDCADHINSLLTLLETCLERGRALFGAKVRAVRHGCARNGSSADVLAVSCGRGSTRSRCGGCRA